MIASPMKPEELQRAKDARTQSLPSGFQTSLIAAATFSQLYVYGLGLDYFSHVGERVNAVTSDQALGAARKYLSPDRMVVVAVGDRAKIEPELRKLNIGPIEVLNPDGKPVS